jgi:hypothetical protein
MSEKINNEIELIKKKYLNQEEEYKAKIRVLQISLAEKNALESVLKEKN